MPQEYKSKKKTEYREHHPQKSANKGTWWCACIVDINEFEHVHASDDMKISRGDIVIITTRFGLDIAKIRGPIRNMESIDASQMRRIIRIAGESDLVHQLKLKEKEKYSFDVCQRYIDDNRLQMNLIMVHYMLNEERMMLYYTADKRIDFRTLIKDLASILNIRLEMRHIGARDESRIHGGVGICGRVCCCHGTMNRLEPVSIKMAKDQNLSLNTQKITGTCGRLLCCLAYEQKYYDGFRGKLPNEGILVSYNNMQYKVIDINVGSATVQLISREGDKVSVAATSLTRRKNGEWGVNAEPDLTSQP